MKYSCIALLAFFSINAFAQEDGDSEPVDDAAKALAACSLIDSAGLAKDLIKDLKDTVTPHPFAEYRGRIEVAVQRCMAVSNELYGASERSLITWFALAGELAVAAQTGNEALMIPKMFMIYDIMYDMTFKHFPNMDWNIFIEYQQKLETE